MGMRPINNLVEFTLVDVVLGSTSIHLFNLNENAFFNISNYYKLWVRILELCNSFPLQSVFKYKSICNHIVDVKLDKTYIEKCDIKWWSLETLSSLYRFNSHNTFRVEFFNFIPEIVNGVKQLIL